MNDAIHELGQQLSSDDPHEREMSALELAELEDLHAAPFLLRALEDEEDAVRRWGAYGLAKLGRAEHAPALRRALEKDQDLTVRMQSAYGLARQGDARALEKLPQYLGAPTAELRRDTAALLLTVAEPAAVRPLLKPLLSARDEHARAWAAGLLHALGDPEAFSHWHSALASPEGRRDAVLAVPHMHEARAIRELLRLLAELAEEELAETGGEEQPSLLELLTEGLRLAGLELLLDADADETLRADLLVLLGRHRAAIPELVDDILEAFAQRPPDKLGRELAELVREREPQERGTFFTHVTTLFPKAALPTLAELKGQEREQVLRGVVELAREAEGHEPQLLELCEVLRATPYGHHFEGLPTSPVTREQELPEEGLDGETGEQALPDEEPAGQEPEDEEEWSEQVPPEPAAVAQRALVLGGLLRRLALEEKLGKAKEPAARDECLKLQKWMDEEGLLDTGSVPGLELIEAEPGTWPVEERQSVSWSAEQLQLLLWALGLGKLPPPEARAEAAPLLERLPLRKPAQPFLESATRRPLEEVAAQRDRWETVLECARYESFARGILADPSIAESDPDLEMLLESAEEVGFDRKSASAKGKAHAVLEGLRHWGRHLASELQQEGLLPGKPGEGVLFQGKPLHELDEQALAALLSLAHGRFEALEWLAAGAEVPSESEGEEEEAG